MADRNFSPCGEVEWHECNVGSIPAKEDESFSHGWEVTITTSKALRDAQARGL